MRILLVEDSHEKVGKVISQLLMIDGVRRDDIDVAFTVADGKKLLRENHYTIMLLDLIIPYRAGDTPSWDGSLNLLIELRDREALKKPTYIVGVTAHEEGAAALSETFTQHTWTIIRYSAADSGWSDQLARAVEWALKASSQNSVSEYKTDVCVICALPSPEYDAILKNGWDWQPAVPIDDVTFVRYGTFVSDGEQRSAVSAFSSKMGMVQAGLLASKMIVETRPKFLAMVGICAGVKGRTNYGDPVVADPCWDWQSGKHVLKDGSSSFEIRPDQVSLNDEVRGKWEQFKSDRNFWSDLKAAWPGAPDTDLRVRLGPSVSGSSVLANEDILLEIKKQHGALVALEMEAYGVLSAPRVAGRPRPIAFSCKSVCDFADDSKDDRWQNYAAYTSSKAVASFFERYMGQLDF